MGVCILKKGYTNLHLLASQNKKDIAIQKIWKYWLKRSLTYCLNKWLPQVKHYTLPFYVKVVKTTVLNLIPPSWGLTWTNSTKCLGYWFFFFLKWTFLPAELERGTKPLQFGVCYNTIDQNFDRGQWHCYAILHLDSLDCIRSNLCPSLRLC